jgi:hypothetical protein
MRSSDEQIVGIKASQIAPASCSAFHPGLRQPVPVGMKEVGGVRIIFQGEHGRFCQFVAHDGERALNRFPEHKSSATSETIAS